MTSSRISVVQDAERVEIAIRPAARFLLFLITAAFTALLAFLAVGAFAKVVVYGGEPLYVAFWIAWALIVSVFAFGMGWNLVWLLVGRDMIILDRIELASFQSFGGRREIRREVFLRDRMSPVRIETRQSKGKSAGLAYVLAFDYEGTATSLAINMTQTDCEELLSGPLSQLVRKQSS